jgi:hypothetical protein
MRKEHATNMAVQEPKEQRKFAYPFGRRRFYFNAIAGVLGLIFSIVFLGSNLPDVTSVATYSLLYLAVTLAVILLSLRLKLYLLKRMENEELESSPLEPEEANHSSLNWKLVLTIILLGVCLLLPLIFALLVDPLWWFIGFSSLVVGFCLSEIPLYQSTNH